ncbi:hypothetical protein [Cytobacillus horneckiae]|uniref:hypothetical protein n=1 Tax=Cytobacillus horneckiae TaxID=549687 RepID=UPI003D9A3C43
MKKFIGVLLFVFLLTGCGGNETTKTVSSGVSVDEYEERVQKVLDEKGDKTEFKIIATEKTEDNEYGIYLSDEVAIFLDTTEEKGVNMATIGVSPSLQLSNEDDFNFAFELLIGTADDELTLGERTKLRQELGLYDAETFTDKTSHSKENNNITFTFRGVPSEMFVLEAKY